MSRGIDRERQVRRVLEASGWWTARAAGSFGDADIVAARPAPVPVTTNPRAQLQLIEVKSTKAGPFHSFGPARRQDLVDAAALAGGEPWLAWWPPRGKLKWYPKESWPT